MGWFVDTVTYIVVAFGFNRGLDLVRSPESQSEINQLLIAGFGQDAWGYALMAASAYVFLAVVNPHRHLLFYYTAPLFGLVAFGTYFITQFWGFIQMGPPYTGLRFITPPLGTALMYAVLIAYQLRELPRQVLGPYKRRATDVKEDDE